MSGELVTLTHEWLHYQVLSYTVSGYPFWRPWSTYHSWDYTRMEFRETDYADFLKLLTRVFLQIEEIQKIDPEIERLISGSVDLV